MNIPSYNITNETKAVTEKNGISCLFELSKDGLLVFHSDAKKAIEEMEEKIKMLKDIILGMHNLVLDQKIQAAPKMDFLCKCENREPVHTEDDHGVPEDELLCRHCGKPRVWFTSKEDKCQERSK